MKLKYKKLKVIDGDSVKVLVGGFGWSVRLVGLDTDELKEKPKRANQQKSILEKFCSRFMKPRLYAEVVESKDGWPTIKSDAYGRWLCRLYVWSWLRLSYIDYAKYMIDKGQVKKGSKWNTG